MNLRPTLRALTLLAIFCAAACAAVAQRGSGGPPPPPPPPGGNGPGNPGGNNNGMGPGGPGRGMGEPNPNDRIERPRRDREQRLGLQGRWWDDQHTASSIHLRPEQQQRMDKIFETNKPALAAALTRLQKQESGLNAMSRKDLQDEDKVYAAIDGVANARAELARQNTRLLLMIRHELDPQQTAALDKQIASAR